MDMPAFFASIDEKIQISIHTIYSGIKSNIQTTYKRENSLTKRSYMKFNNRASTTNQTINNEGAKAYKMSPEVELYTAVVTSSLSNKFYESSEKRIQRIKLLMQRVSPEFIAKLAIYAREEMYLRSIPLVLTVELARIHSGDSLVKNTVARVVKRADEITELLAYYQLANSRTGLKKLNKISKQIQKGLSIAFNKFDEYQFAKYNRATEIKIKDALFLVHPKAKDEAQQELFNKIVADTLETPYTWEVELSNLGQAVLLTKEARSLAVKEKWEELIDSRKLGYMAMLRNLRNILHAAVSEQHIEKVTAFLSDEYQVQRSRQLPVRFLSAYRELEILNLKNKKYILSALETAVSISVKNIKGLDSDTKVLLASDVSGSMYSPISPKSKVRNYDIGLLLSMLLHSQSENVVTGIFGDSWETVNLPREKVLKNTTELNKMEGKVGYSTNGFKVIEYLNKGEIVLDKIMIFTDAQLWNSFSDSSQTIEKEWKFYKKNVAPKAKLYLFDLTGYGQSPLKNLHNDVHIIAGWSDKIFEVLDAISEGKSAIDKINSIRLYE